MAKFEEIYESSDIQPVDMFPIYKHFHQKNKKRNLKETINNSINLYNECIANNIYCFESTSLDRYETYNEIIYKYMKTILRCNHEKNIFI